MPRVDLSLRVDIENTARVVQLRGMFDVPEKKVEGVEYHFEVPLHEQHWKVGLIVGPSGAGKSTVARHLFAQELVEGYDWLERRAVVENFGDLPMADIVGALSAVGFASPPAWMKPFHVLSNGEKFRCTLARAILDPRPLVVVDEFSSVVDRQVARIGAYATAKAVRAKPGKQFVAVTCHEDVLEWLQPDWVCEPHIGRFSWRSPGRRPPVALEIVRASAAAWPWFAPHHYLSGELAVSARCFVGLVEGELAAFTSVLHQPHPAAGNLKRLHRTVVLPDYQGLGIGVRITDLVGGVCTALGFQLSTVLAHPALIRARARSPVWRMTRAPSVLRGHDNIWRSSTDRRRTASFKYVGPGFPDRRAAERLWSLD